MFKIIIVGRGRQPQFIETCLEGAGHWCPEQTPARTQLASQAPGPSGIKIFNPGIFRDGILPNPGIPGFFGTGFTLIFNPGIVQKFLRDFSGFLFLLRVLVKSHHFHQSLSLSPWPPHPQEGSRMSAQHMKRLSQMLPQTLTNWIGGRTTRKHFLFLLFWSGLSLQSQWQAVKVNESFQLQAMLSLQRELRLLQSRWRVVS